MPPKKRYHIGRYDANAKRTRRKRQLETPEERDIRRKKDRERTAKFRASETVEQRARRLQIQRERTANYRALKKDRQRRAQLEDEKKRAAEIALTAQRQVDRTVKKEPVVNTDECSGKINENLQSSSTVFVKTEWECEIEEGFQENEVTQDETEDELEPPTTVFLKTETMCDIEEALPEENNEESWEEKAFHGKEASQNAEEDPLAPSSGSEFLASIRQKIAGALSARWRDHQESRELVGN
ncbi:hypothetical protein R5R35_011030 [Gryllus longicercus]|uniref:Uncharacterized protein n=1 Tax=Gryllus longicercus TaxID=2509291 RepID=A0AAN9VBY6_9ORTH